MTVFRETVEVSDLIQEEDDLFVVIGLTHVLHGHHGFFLEALVERLQILLCPGESSNVGPPAPKLVWFLDVVETADRFQGFTSSQSYIGILNDLQLIADRHPTSSGSCWWHGRDMVVVVMG